MKITNVSKGKLVLAAGFSLAPGQSRNATEAEAKTFNLTMMEAWIENKLITVGGGMPPVAEDSDADNAAKEAAKAEADNTGKSKLPGAK